MTKLSSGGSTVLVVGSQGCGGRKGGSDSVGMLVGAENAGSRRGSMNVSSAAAISAGSTPPVGYAIDSSFPVVVTG